MFAQRRYPSHLHSPIVLVRKNFVDLWRTRRRPFQDPRCGMARVAYHRGAPDLQHDDHQFAGAERLADHSRPQGDPLESTGVYWRPVLNVLEEGRTISNGQSKGGQFSSDCIFRGWLLSSPPNWWGAQRSQVQGCGGHEPMSLTKVVLWCALLGCVAADGCTFDLFGCNGEVAVSARPGGRLPRPAGMASGGPKQ